MWWSLLPTALHTPLKISWSHSCTYCHTQLLNTERNGWCCNKGKYIDKLPSLLPLPNQIQELCFNRNIRFSWLSRRINALYSFTTIGTTGSFINFAGISNVAVTGRVYHRMLDLSHSNHSLHWFLFDEQGRYTTAHQHHIPIYVLEKISATLRAVNPYIYHLRSAIETIPNPAHSYAIELDLPTNGAELAAIIHASNLTHIEERKIVVFKQGNSQPKFVSIL